VRIAVLDSGTPPPIFNNQGRVLSIFDQNDIEDDQFGHATAIGSILFGGNDIRGLCEQAEPVYVKVLNSEGKGSVKSVANGIFKAIDADVDLINLSLGFFRTENCPKLLKKACEAAFEAGKIIICAAGNDGGPVNWPAALKTTICVGAIRKNDTKSSFSSVGEVDFVAPGINLPVLTLQGTKKLVAGTSFATALVTGVTALLISERKALGMPIEMEEIRTALRSRTVDVGTPGWDKETGFGLIAGQEPIGLKIEQSVFGKIQQKIRSLFGFRK
jgi:subtilisin family serine protease